MSRAGVLQYDIEQFRDYVAAVRMHCAHLDAQKIPHKKITVRADIEAFMLDSLKNLGAGGEYIGKGGNLDFLLEEAGKWGQAGRETVVSHFKRAYECGAKITLIGGGEPIRRGFSVAETLLAPTNSAGISWRVIDHALRAILVKSETEPPRAAVWYSFGGDSAVWGTDDPALSTREGYIVEGYPAMLAPLEHTLRKLIEQSTDAHTIISNIKKRFQRARGN